MSTKNNIRNIFASMHLALISLIIVSGAIFMHKEVKSTGEIVMHNHPYDFTSNQQKPHDSDDQIDFLNVVYNQTYVQTAFIVFEKPILTIFHIFKQHGYTDSKPNLIVSHSFLRGPPLFA